MTAREDGLNTGMVVLKLRLGACLTLPTRRARRQLHEASRLYLRAKNRMAQAWNQFHLSQPDLWLRPALAGIRTTGQLPDAQRRGGFSPAKVVSPAGNEVTMRTLLYHYGREVSPELSSGLVSFGSGDVISDLQTKMSGRGWHARYKWQAVLLNEINLSTYRSLEIPFLCNTSALAYGGDVSCDGHKQLLTNLSSDSCLIGFPLWSPASGREFPYLVFRVFISRLTRGQREWIRLLAERKLKVSDSMLVYEELSPQARRRKRSREPGEWYLHLAFNRPAYSLSLDKDVFVELLANGPDNRQPFTLCDPRGSRGYGYGPLLEDMCARLDRRRLNLRTEYSLSGSGQRGHGRQRIERYIRPITRRVRHVVQGAMKKLVADIVANCVRHNAGTLYWSPPSLQARPNLWHARHGVYWDWTNFQSHLTHRCHLHGIQVCERQNAGQKLGGRSRSVNGGSG